RVGPPFWARSRSSGFLFTRSPGPSKPHVFLSSRSCPEDLTSPSQLACATSPLPFATMVSSSLANIDPERFPPTAALLPSAVFCASVELLSRRLGLVPPSRIPPPLASWALARLSAIVLLVTSAGESMMYRPPPSATVPPPVTVAVLSLIVLDTIVRGPPTTLIPPPSPTASAAELLSLTVLLMSVSSPGLAEPLPLEIPPPSLIADAVMAEFATVLRLSVTAPTQLTSPPPSVIAPPSAPFPTIRL